MSISEQTTANIIEITTPNNTVIVEKLITNVVEIAAVETDGIAFKIMTGETSAIIEHALNQDYLRVVFINSEGVLVRPVIRYIDATQFEVSSNTPMFGKIVYKI